jgi:hypothetical protein
MKNNRCISKVSFALGASAALFAHVCWAQQWGSRGPAARLGQSAVLDPASNKMIVFGGYTFSPDAPPAVHFNDVWYLNSAAGTSANLNWQQATPAGTPPYPRGGHTAVMDAKNNRMIVFGGFEGYANPVDNDVWVLENANGVGGTPTWVQLTPSGTPPQARSNHVAVYNPNSNRMTIFGGNDGEPGGEFDDVWVLENANGLGGTPTWIQLIGQGFSPLAARDSATAVYDVKNNIMMVFGGHNSGTLYSDTWLLYDADGTPSNLCNGVGCWAGPLNTSAFPPPSARFGHTAFFDAPTDTMYVFGGYNGTSLLNDYWVLTQANALSGVWTQVAPTGVTPVPRFYHTAVYNSSNHRMIVFGGEITSAGVLTDAVSVLSQANTP